MGEIIYNGTSSRSFGLEVETFPSYQTPKRSYEQLHIPGRNGDLILDGGSWENGTRSYSISIGSLKKTYFEMANDLSKWLHASFTYTRLEDSYEPDVYRLAVFLDEFELSNLFHQGGKATIEFNCKPQRFLKSGDQMISIEESGTSIENPTTFASRPIIHVYGVGEGSLEVGTYPITISDIGTQLTLDSEIQDAYSGTQNKNPVVTIPNGFPVLPSGKTTITFSGGISKVEVIPKWFTI